MIEHLNKWLNTTISECLEEYLLYREDGNEEGFNRFEGFINALTYVQDKITELRSASKDAV